MSNATRGKFSGPGEGNVYAEANEVIVKITGDDTNQTFEVVEENCKPGFQSNPVRIIISKPSRRFISLTVALIFKLETSYSTPK
ncbi:MAG: hypothetical protein WA445_13645 [Pseudolabrys sp.]